MGLKLLSETDLEFQATLIFAFYVLTSEKIGVSFSILLSFKALDQTRIIAQKPFCIPVQSVLDLWLTDPKGNMVLLDKRTDWQAVIQGKNMSPA